MINVEPCRGCGRPLIKHRVANLVVRLEPTPLDLNGIMGELAASRSLWMVDEGKVRPARPGETGPLREHRCTETAQAALSRPQTPSPGKETTPAPKGRPAGSQTPSWGSQTAPSSVRSAVQPRSDTRSHPCDGCGKSVELDGAVDYMALELGATVMWAIHDGCGRKY